MDTCSNSNNGGSRVQHVAKASSDELLRKFAEVGSEKEDKISAKKELQLAKRLKRSSNRANKAGVYGYGGRMYVDQNISLSSANASIVERKCLLPPVTSRRSVPLVRRLGIGKAKVRAREIKNRSFMGAIEKTWRRTIEGASRVFMEKHYNRHKRLTNDLY